jgi:hypothetical protein
MESVFLWMPFATMAISIVSTAITVIVVVRSLRQRRRCLEQHTVNVASIAFKDGHGEVIAVIRSDGETVVRQPDKIRAAGDGLVEHLAEVAARAAAEQEFGVPEGTTP